MLRAALLDLRWRRRRFAIAVLGAALVLGMTLLMTGVAAGFDAEAESTVADLDADGWVVRTGSAGPFLGASPMAAAEVDRVLATPGVEAASPVVLTRKSVRVDGGEIDVNVFGALAGGVAVPMPDRGEAFDAPGEVMVSSRLAGYDVGDVVTVSGTDLRVVGEVDDSTSLAGTPNLFLGLADAQALGFAGQPVANAIAVRGTPTGLPEGLTAVSNEVATADLLRAIAKAKSSLSLISVLLWIVAASIVGAVTYLSVLERQRDFAVFKATGVATRSILGGLALQSAVVALTAAAAGAVIGTLIGPRFPMLVSLELRSYVLLPVVAVAVGLAASTVGLKRVAGVDPALAFGGP